MIRVRSAALMAPQRAISSMVRPHPRQETERASSVQILTQGLSIMISPGTDSSSEHKRSAWEGNHDDWSQAV